MVENGVEGYFKWQVILWKFWNSWYFTEVFKPIVFYGGFETHDILWRFLNPRYLTGVLKDFSPIVICFRRIWSSGNIIYEMLGMTMWGGLSEPAHNPLPKSTGRLINLASITGSPHGPTTGRDGAGWPT